MYCLGPFVSNKCQECRDNSCPIQIEVARLHTKNQKNPTVCVDCPRKKTLYLLQ
jgi:hypothetical protein